MRRTVLLVGALTVLVHLPGVLAPDASFVYDDTRFILLNEDVRTLRAPWAYLDPGTIGPDGAGIYRPLRTLSFALDHALFGERVRWWRLESVLLHGLAAALLAVLLARLVESRAAAILGALVFAFHPVTAEVSSWLSSRGDLLAMIGALAAMLLHLRGRPAAAAAAFFLGLLGKEMIITLPALVLLLDAARGARPLRDRRSVIAHGAMAGTALLYLLLRRGTLGTEFAQPGIESWVPARALGFLHEVRITLLPVDLGFDHRFAGGATAIAGAVAVLSGLGVLAIVAWRRGARLTAAGLLWFPVALLPVSILPLNIATADRFLYVSLAGVSLGVSDLARRIRPRGVRIAAAGIVLLLLASLGGARTRVYASPGALWDEARRVDPDNPRAIEGLAYDAYRRERYAEAREGFRRFIDRIPEDAKARRFLAETDRQLARRHPEARRALVAEALAQYREAIHLWRGGVRRGRDMYLARTCLSSARLAVAVGDAGRAEADARAAVEAGAREEGLEILGHLVGMGIEKDRLDDAARAARAILALDRSASASSVMSALRAHLGPRAPGCESRLDELRRRLR